MSLNIQTTTGLLEIGGKVTKENNSLCSPHETNKIKNKMKEANNSK